MKGLLSAIMVSLPMFAEIAYGASVVNQQMTEQVTTVLEQMVEDENTTLPLSGSQQERAYFSICQNEESGYGVLIGAPKTKCLTYNQEFEQLELPGEYQIVDVEREFNQVTKAFLAQQSNVNQGFWQQDSAGVCYSTNKNSTSRPLSICLREVAPVTLKETDPTPSFGHSHAGEVVGYLIFGGAVLFVVGGVLFHGLLPCVSIVGA